MSKKKKKDKGIIYEETDQINANVNISKEEIKILVDISPDGCVPDDERIQITRFDGDPNLIPENDEIFLHHESNDMVDIDHEKFAIATNRNKTKVNIVKLEELSRDKDPEIRAAVSRSPFISGGILHLLAKDKKKTVRESVASNRFNLKKETLQLLMRDKDMYVRNTLSSNTLLTPELINEMLLIESKDILVMCNLMFQLNKKGATNDV